MFWHRKVISEFESKGDKLSSSAECKIRTLEVRHLPLPITWTGWWIPVFAWSSIAQSVCEWVFSLLTIWCFRLPTPRFEFCTQQRKTTCLPSIQNHFSVPEHYQNQPINEYIFYAENQTFCRCWNGQQMNRRFSPSSKIVFPQALNSPTYKNNAPCCFWSYVEPRYNIQSISCVC